MDKAGILQRIEQWKLLAEIFTKNNSKIYIKTLAGDLHFCIIVLSGEDSITVDNFGPEQRAGKRDRIYWLEISDFDEYKNKGENEDEGNSNKV